MYGIEIVKGVSYLQEHTIPNSTQRLTIHSITKTDLQRAYILLLILVVWHWQPLDGWQVSKSY